MSTRGWESGEIEVAPLWASVLYGILFNEQGGYNDGYFGNKFCFWDFIDM
jgi:hypothetical protein